MTQQEGSDAWQGPYTARPEEFGEAMRFTDLVFRPGQTGRRIVQSQYPHAYRDEPAFARRLLLLRHRGDLVGCLAVHPLTLRLGEARLRAGGIGIVGAHPERRGEGIMTRLLHAAVERMERRGQAISILGGDRQRYGHFGWENAGVRTIFHLTARSMGEVPHTSARPRRWPRRPTDAWCRRVLRAARARPFGVDRHLSDIAPLLGRRGKAAWILEEGRRFAFAVAGGPDRTEEPYTAIHEFGGDPELCRRLFHHLLPRAQNGMLAVLVGPNPADHAFLTPLSARWVRLPDGMARLVDAGRTVEQVSPEIRRRARAAGVGGRFDIRLTGEVGDVVRLDLGHGPRRRLRLDRRELVDLLFGGQPVAERFGDHPGVPARALAPLAAVLPLPLHVPSLDHI